MTDENGQTHHGGNSAVDALAYGFKWFEYHANQRITTFNFYLVVYTGLVAGYGFLLKEKIVVGSVFINLIMVLLSILFWQLDVRDRQLIEIGETSSLKLGHGGLVRHSKSNQVITRKTV